MKSRRTAPSASALVALASLLLLAPTPALCAPHEALRRQEQQCRCISLPSDDAAQASVIQLSVISRAHHRHSEDVCPTFTPRVQQWRASSNATDAQALAALLQDGPEHDGLAGVLEFVSPLPDGVLEEIEQGEVADVMPESLGMAGTEVEGDELRSGAVVCRAVDFDQAAGAFESRRVMGLCKVVLSVFVLACVAEVVGRVGGKLYRRFFPSRRHPRAIFLNCEKPLWMSSTTFADLKMALDEDEDDYRSSVL